MCNSTVQYTSGVKFTCSMKYESEERGRNQGMVRLLLLYVGRTTTIMRQTSNVGVAGGPNKRREGKLPLTPIWWLNNKGQQHGYYFAITQMKNKRGNFYQFSCSLCFRGSGGERTAGRIRQEMISLITQHHHYNQHAVVLQTFVSVLFFPPKSIIYGRLFIVNLVASASQHKRPHHLITKSSSSLSWATTTPMNC